MNSRILLLTTTLLLVTACAQAAVIVEKYTVIPVVLDDSLSSKTNRVGDTFNAHCMGANCAGFPSPTTFVGRITDVMAKQGDQPGHIHVAFTAAVLPDGTKVPIDAVLSSAEGVASGDMQGKQAKKGARTKGAAIGAGLGALIGGNKWKGALWGGAAGWALGDIDKGKTKDIDVPAGTKFYIALRQRVILK